MTGTAADRQAVLADLDHCAAAIRAGGVIAYPTEAVFGLGCDPRSEAALARLLEVKQREVGKGMILIAASLEQLAPFMAPLTAEQLQRLRDSWPGPETWVVPASPDLSPLVTGHRDTVAVRVTDHPLAAALCRACGHPLTSTSANLSGSEPLREAAAVEAELGDRVDAVLDGPVGNLRQPTRIRDLRSGEVLR